MIRQVYSSNSVDNVPLLVNNKASDFRTVILYCDDQGIAKKLPLNERATSLCCAVKRPVQVRIRTSCNVTVSFQQCLEIRRT